MNPIRTLVSVAALALVVGSACKREERRFNESPPLTEPAQSVQVSQLHPAGEAPSTSAPNAYEESAYAVSEGKRLYMAYNCVGCHANGGGGMGPPLMDANWIYGGAPQQIFATIVEGRPGGMPSFRGKIPEFQVWEIVAYVRSMSGQLGKNVSPSRSDHMSAKKPESEKQTEHPKVEKPATGKPEKGK